MRRNLRPLTPLFNPEKRRGVLISGNTPEGVLPDSLAMSRTITTTAATGAVALTSNATLAPAGSTTASAIPAVTVTQAHNLTPADPSASSNVENVTLL